MTDSTQLLEKVLERMSGKKESFPRMTMNYYVSYQSLLSQLRSDIYPNIDAGLALNSAQVGYYTLHNSEHFDEVVRYAGDLLGLNERNFNEWDMLEPYELYVLLIAIRVHDAGNIEGREKHEKKCFHLLRNYSSLLGDDISEIKIIANIAQAHGGKNNDDKDTISYLSHNFVGKIKIRPQLIAAVLRFADEICESRGRASNYLLNKGLIPTHNEIYHNYAAAIGSAHYCSKEKKISLRYCIAKNKVVTKFGCEERVDENKVVYNECYLVDEIYRRIEKMDMERRYCNNYTRDLYVVEKIRAVIDVLDEDHEVLHSIVIPELDDKGYPDGRVPNIAKMVEINGSDIAIQFSDKES